MFTKIENLIKTWHPDNIELAITLLKANNKLFTQFEDCYDPLLNAFDESNTFTSFSWEERLRHLPLSIASEPLFNNQIPYSLTFERLIATMPISVLNYSYYQQFPWWVNQLSKLEQLRFHNCKFDTFPINWAASKTITHLSLSQMSLKEMPNFIRDLENLEELSLINTNLYSLPEWLRELQYLKTLIITNNNLVQLPESLGQLKNLEELTLNNNPLKGLPSSLKQLNAINWIDVSSTPLGKQKNCYAGFYTQVDAPLFLDLLGELT